MKTANKIFLAAAAALSLFSSCVNEKIEPGVPENDSYGVYFQTLTASQKSIELDPADAAEIKFSVYREKENDDIVVPVKLTASYETEDGVHDATDIFSLTEIKFEDGQKETAVTIRFKDAALGTTYTCAVECVDERFVHIYTDKPTGLSFEVTRVKWNLVKSADGLETTGLWRDGVITDALVSSIFTDPTLESPVEIYERDDIPGYYRISDVYNKEFCSKWFVSGVIEEYQFKFSSQTFYIDATDPAKVFFDGVQDTGVNIGADANIRFLSALSTYFDGMTDVYGTLENGVIKFPKDAVLYHNGAKGWYYGNSKEMLRVVFPGCKDNDYKLELGAGQSDAEGKLPVSIVIGEDVAKAKYAVYSGTISDADKSFKALEVSRDENAAYVTESSEVKITCEETGIYTVVVAALDAKNELVNYDVVQISYVAAGDKQPVVFSCGINSAERYVGQGYSTDNTLEVWCYGTDITEAHIAVVKHVEYMSDPEGTVKAVAASEPADDEILAEINDGGFSSPVTKLLPGTAYRLVIVASNGYETKVFVPETIAKTTGDPLPIYDEYTLDDASEEFTPEKSEGLFGTYNMYAVNYLKTLGMREYFSKVTIGDSDEPDTKDEDGNLVEYFETKGMFANTAAKLGFDDTMIWQYYRGYIYNIVTDFGKAENAEYYLLPMVSNAEADCFTGTGLLVGAVVDDGYIAFCCHPKYEAQYAFDGYYLGYFRDEEYENESFVGDVYSDFFADILLVDETKDKNGIAPEAGKAATAAFRSASKRTFRTNFVETREGQIKSMIDAAISARSHNFATPSSEVICKPVSNPVSFTSEVTPGVTRQTECPVSLSDALRKDKGEAFMVKM